MTMNKTVLEKLLHGYNLVHGNGKKFIDNFTAAPHMTHPADRSYVDGAQYEHLDIRPERMHAYMKYVSQGISQSAKFYIPRMSESEDLSFEEKIRIAPEVEMFLPYESTYVQYDCPEADEGRGLVYNFWAVDAGYKSQPDGSPYEKYGEQPCISVMLMPYCRETGKFHMDYCAYDMTWHPDGSYTFWIHDKNEFKDWIDLKSDSNGQYTNQSLNNFIAVANEIMFELCLRLQYPTIVDTIKTEGLPPSDRYSVLAPKHYKASTFYGKPTWQHKTLKINMYGNKSTKLGSKGSRESGTAFHSVRKHMRKLSSGKTTFVKAHFRGSREHGVIDKDYELVQ